MRESTFIDVSRWRLVGVGTPAAILFFGALATGLWAQQPASAPTVSGTLVGKNSEAAQAQSSASIGGTVRDSRGSLFARVPVTLVGEGKAAYRVVEADDNGVFVFTDLPAGTYRAEIHVSGLEPFASSPVVVGAGEKRELPVVTLHVATKTTTVDVVATQNDVAQAQVNAEEKQRLFGLLPDYYTSYIWNAAPMTRKLKFKLALRTTTDPVTFLVVAGVAGVEQGHKTFPGYGQGFEGYAKRYGASYADLVSGRMFGSAIFPILLHQDPRYFYQGSGSTRSRLLYALISTFVCREDDGRREPNYSYVLGSFTAAGFSNLYRAPQDRRASLTFRNGLIITASGAVVNVFREFVTRKLTSGVPPFANGKP